MVKCYDCDNRPPMDGRPLARNNFAAAPSSVSYEVEVELRDPAAAKAQCADQQRMITIAKSLLYNLKVLSSTLQPSTADTGERAAKRPRHA